MSAGRKHLSVLTLRFFVHRKSGRLEDYLDEVHEPVSKRGSVLCYRDLPSKSSSKTINSLKYKTRVTTAPDG